MRDHQLGCSLVCLLVLMSGNAVPERRNLPRTSRLQRPRNTMVKCDGIGSISASLNYCPPMATHTVEEPPTALRSLKGSRSNQHILALSRSQLPSQCPRLRRQVLWRKAMFTLTVPVTSRNRCWNMLLQAGYNLCWKAPLIRPCLEELP